MAKSGNEGIIMAKSGNEGSLRKMRPGLTPESREMQMVSLAVDLAEKQLREGTAPAQVITHYLKIGSTRATLEKERLEEENKLLRAKTEALQSSKKMEELYTKAIDAMRRYSGEEGDSYEEDEEDDRY